jgi:NADPH-dependent F420 reductase
MRRVIGTAFHEVRMRIAVVGGTGKEGRGMALRWARAGHAVFIGSRDAERAADRASELRAQLVGQGSHGSIEGGDNLAAVRSSEVVVLCVPYAAHGPTLHAIQAELGTRVLIDVTVPVKPPRVDEVHLPPGNAAALEAKEILGPDAKVVAALHHVSAVHLRDLAHEIECDVLACSDDPVALELALGLIRDLGVRAFDAGPLRNAVALESLTPVLLHLNRSQKGRSVGIRITGA